MMHIGTEKQKNYKFKMEDKLNLFKDYENRTILS